MVASVESQSNTINSIIAVDNSINGSQVFRKAGKLEDKLKAFSASQLCLLKALKLSVNVLQLFLTFYFAFVGVFDIKLIGVKNFSFCLETMNHYRQMHSKKCRNFLHLSMLPLF